MSEVPPKQTRNVPSTSSERERNTLKVSKEFCLEVQARTCLVLTVLSVPYSFDSSHAEAQTQCVRRGPGCDTALSLSLSHTHTHTSLSLALFHSFSFYRSLSLTRARALSRSVSLCSSISLTPSLCLFSALSLALSRSLLLSRLARNCRSRQRRYCVRPAPNCGP